MSVIIFHHLLPHLSGKSVCQNRWAQNCWITAGSWCLYHLSLSVLLPTCLPCCPVLTLTSSQGGQVHYTHATAETSNDRKQLFRCRVYYKEELSVFCTQQTSYILDQHRLIGGSQHKLGADRVESSCQSFAK